MPIRELLDEAVARGILSLQQRNEVLTLAGEPDDRPRGLTGEFLAWAREAPRGFNAITIAYGVGALAVVFALIWFLADRWNALGPAGVLIVAVVYAGVFGAAARVFTRERFPTAHGVAVLLVVITTPLIMWATLRVTGIWSDDFQAACGLRDAPFWDCRSRALVLAATTLAAALAAMRRLRFGPLMIPGAAALAVVLSQLALEASRGDGGRELLGWSMLFSASMLATIGYEIDRRRGREDYGGWVHIAAAVCATIALASLFRSEQSARHLVLPMSLAAMTASLFLRRIVWLLFGLGALFSYLTWLATEVFENAVAFPVILAAVGIAVILVTVWVQRTYPRIAARVREADGARARFPGGAGLLLAPALAAVLVMPAERERARCEDLMRQADVERLRIIGERDIRTSRPRQSRVPGDNVPVRPRPQDSVPPPATVVPPPDSSSR
jgi:hypothetical protein